MTRTPADLDQFIRQHAIDAELVHPPHETPTVPLAAQAMNCAEEQIIKSVLFLIPQGAALVIANGTAKIDARKLAAVFGVGRKRVKLATAVQVQSTTGFPAGGVPPFGYPAPIATYIDAKVLEQPVVFGGGGDEHTLMRVTPQELLRATQAEVIDARE